LPNLDKYKGKLAGKIVIFDTQNTLKRSAKPDLERYTDEQLAEMAAAKPQAGGQRRAFDPNSPQMLREEKQWQCAQLSASF
jgi:carboxypeptidase Q